MDYIEIKIAMPKEKVDLVSTFLIAGGYDCFEICDFSDILENAGEMFCDYIEDRLLEKRDEAPYLRFYCESDGVRASEIESYLLGVCRQLGWHDVTCEKTLVENSDWEECWKKYFFPFPVGQRLFIKPTWQAAESAAVGERKIIEIDPAAAFGSGTHATTRLCLETMERFISGGERILDMGCGSGILGIGALKLGAQSVEAVDIDETAVRTARENFLINGCDEGNFSALCGNVLAEPAFCEKLSGGYDLILANIVAQIIQDMAPFLYRMLKNGGTLIASGILAPRAEEVRTKLEQAGFLFRQSHSADEWVCIEFEKQPHF